MLSGESFLELKHHRSHSNKVFKDKSGVVAEYDFLMLGILIAR